MSPCRPMEEEEVSPASWCSGYRFGRRLGNHEQFWPSTLDIEAMFPAPKAAAGVARATRIISPKMRPWLRRSIMVPTAQRGRELSRGNKGFGCSGVA
jgi:hypothetical protein